EKSSMKRGAYRCESGSSRCRRTTRCSVTIRRVLPEARIPTPVLPRVYRPQRPAGSAIYEILRLLPDRRGRSPAVLNPSGRELVPVDLAWVLVPMLVEIQACVHTRLPNSVGRGTARRR